MVKLGALLLLVVLTTLGCTRGSDDARLPHGAALELEQPPPAPPPTTPPDRPRASRPGQARWPGPHPLASANSPAADFRRRLIPTAWTVEDINGSAPAHELILEFHEAAPGELQDWVGISNGCVTVGWYIDWVEGDGDIGIVRRLTEESFAGSSHRSGEQRVLMGVAGAV